MIYRLKDHEYQKRLDEVSGGTFSKGLRNAIVDLNSDHVTVSFSTLKERNFKFNNNLIPIKWNQLEETDEFDRRDWNDYPFVTPPLDEMMRCEYTDQYGYEHHFGAVFTVDEDGEGHWVDDDGSHVPCDRFRPWDD